MSSPDNEAANNNKTESELEGPSSKTFHYVSLPRVMLERIDDQVLSDLNTGKSHVTKKPFKKSTKSVSQKSGRRNSPRNKNSLPEKRRIKLTNKGEETLHIIDFRGNSTRKFIMEDQEYHKSNGDVTKQNQNVIKNSKTVQKPLLVVRSKTEINKLADKKLNSTPVVPVFRKRNTKEGILDSKNLQNKQIDLPSNSYSKKQNTSAIQINKNLQSKQSQVIGHPYGIRHDGKFEKGNSGGMQVNKNVQNKQREAASHLHDMKQNVSVEKQNTGRIQVNKDIQNKQREVVSQYDVKHNASPAKQNSAPVQVDKDVQNKQRDIISQYIMKQNTNTGKQNTAPVQVDKNVHNKQTEVVSHPYGEKHNSNTEKVVSPTQNKISGSKEILSKQTLSSFVQVNTQGPSPAKRKLLEEHYQHNKVQKLCKSSDIVSTENSGVNNTSSFVNNTKVPPDRKTAKVVPLAKARKSITLPKSDVTIVNEVKSSRQKSDKSADNLEAVSLLSKLVGMPISADKMEIVLRRENENKEISVNKIPHGPPPKRSQGISNLSKLLSDSLKPSTSEAKITATSVTTATTILSAASLSSTQPVTTTTTTSTTSNITVTTQMSVPGNRNIPTTTSGPVHTKECVLAHDHLCTKTPTSAASPAKFSSSASAAQPATIKNSVDIEVVNGAARQQSLSQNASPSEDSKTIYDVMADVSVLFPAWNLHILEDTNTFCIAYIARNSAGVPALAKCIELDEQFNAKVYVHQYHCKQFDGQYNDEDSIVSLVNRIHSLKA